MSDFLTRVAERALGTAPRIDPQSASRYTPSRLPLPLPETPLPEITTAAAASDFASITTPRDSSVAPPARPHSSPPPIVTPLTEDTVADDPDYVPALKPERSPERPGAEAAPIESPARSITQTTSQSKSVAQQTPVDSQTLSMAEENRDAPHADRAAISERPPIDTSSLTEAFESATIRDAARHPLAELSPFESQNSNRKTPDEYVSAPTETATPRVEDEPRAAELVSRPSHDRDVESQISVAADSIRPATTPSTIVVPDDRQPPLALDHHHETRGAISADFVRPATARVDQSNYQRAETSEPSIRVTIGRVEVRAAPPPAVVEPVAPPPTPKLSLAEFLRQHNERRR